MNNLLRKSLPKRKLRGWGGPWPATPRLARRPVEFRRCPPGIGAEGRTRCAALACVLALCAAMLAGAENLQDLKPQGYVNDFAGVLSPAARQKLTALCSEVQQKTKAQIAVVTIHTLGDDSLEDFSVNLAQKWGVGPKSDRGVMILLVVNDHRYRVEVGYGLEPVLTDGMMGRFGREMIPALRQRDYDDALLQITGSIAAEIAKASGVTLTSAPPPRRQPRSDEDQGFSPALLALIVLGFIGFGALRFLIFPMIFGFGRRGFGGWGGGPWMGGGFGGGGFGGGGGGGGGFGGFGGGSFGGGGASGSW